VELDDHTPTAVGRAFLWGGIALGLILLAALLTHGFGLLAANSWYANQVNKRALIEADGLSLRNAHAFELFKNEGLAPDAAEHIASFLANRKAHR
jgi:hypothetical protein